MARRCADSRRDCWRAQARATSASGRSARACAGSRPNARHGPSPSALATVCKGNGVDGFRPVDHLRDYGRKYAAFFLDGLDKNETSADNQRSAREFTGRRKISEMCLKSARTGASSPSNENISRSTKISYIILAGTRKSDT